MFDKMETVEIQVEGMTCMHCQKHVADALGALKGVKKAEVSLTDKKASVLCNPAKVSREDLVQVVKDAGYDAR